MRAGAAVLAALVAVSAAAEVPPAADAPRMWRVEGGYMMNEAGYTRLAEEAARLQLAERAMTARVRELEASQGVPLEALGTVAGLALVAGVMLGVLARGAVPAR